jgi:hypothetical protein
MASDVTRGFLDGALQPKMHIFSKILKEKKQVLWESMRMILGIQE